MRPLVIKVEDVESRDAWVYVLDDSPVVLGRGDGASLRIARPFMSQTHGTFAFDEARGAWTYADLDSASGTSAGGRRLAPEEVVPLVPDTTLAIGSLALTVLAEAPATRPPLGAESPFAAPTRAARGAVPAETVPLAAVPAALQSAPRSAPPAAAPSISLSPPITAPGRALSPIAAARAAAPTLREPLPETQAPPPLLTGGTRYLPDPSSLAGGTRLLSEAAPRSARRTTRSRPAPVAEPSGPDSRRLLIAATAAAVLIVSGAFALGLLRRSSSSTAPSRDPATEIAEPAIVPPRPRPALPAHAPRPVPEVRAAPPVAPRTHARPKIPSPPLPAPAEPPAPPRRSANGAAILE